MMTVQKSAVVKSGAEARAKEIDQLAWNIQNKLFTLPPGFTPQDYWQTIRNEIEKLYP